MGGRGLACAREKHIGPIDPDASNSKSDSTFLVIAPRLMLSADRRLAMHGSVMQRLFGLRPSLMRSQTFSLCEALTDTSQRMRPGRSQRRADGAKTHVPVDGAEDSAMF